MIGCGGGGSINCQEIIPRLHTVSGVSVGVKMVGGSEGSGGVCVSAQPVSVMVNTVLV